MELDRTSHFTNLYTLVGCLTKAIDLVSPQMAGHHQQVAYLSHKIADAMGLSFTTERSLVVAALIHDVGAIDSNESEPFSPQEKDSNKDGHAKLGAELLSGLPLLSDVSNIILYHHQPWLSSQEIHPQQDEIPLGSRIIHLADRVAIQLDKRANVISQIGDIKEYVMRGRGTNFDPKVADAFLSISKGMRTIIRTKHVVWEEVESVFI
jgi:putative nucleotidyltransferase with HDIG domain